MQRIGLFLLTNIAVIMVLSFVARLLGVSQILDEQGGLNIAHLLAFCAVFGMGGSFISLAISKWMALRSTGARVIRGPAEPRGATAAADRVPSGPSRGNRHAGCRHLRLPRTQRLRHGSAPDKALVAVSTGLLRNMRREEVEAVLGHEVSHVANGDMITLSLIQGIVNTFVMFLARVVGFFVDRVILKNERGLGLGYFATTIVCQIIFGILASTVVFWFSRRREFRADAGGARLAGRQSMIAALEALQRGSAQPGAGAYALPKEMAAFGISSGGRGALSRLFMTHPPLEERIAALRSGG